MAKARAWANVKPKVNPKSRILPNSIRAVLVYSWSSPHAYEFKDKYCNQGPNRVDKDPFPFQNGGNILFQGDVSQDGGNYRRAGNDDKGAE